MTKNKHMRDEFLSRSPRQALFRLAVRLFVYAVLLGAIAFGTLWGAVVYDDAFYAEIGPVETLQTILALVSALVFLLAAKNDPQRMPCSVLLGSLFFCMMVRESDYFLDELVSRHTWKVLVSMILILTVLYVMRNTPQTIKSVMSFTSESSFGIFVSGLLVLIVFSRLFGYGDFWEAIIGDYSYRTVKTIVEEGVELMGYFLLLVSSFEYRHSARIKKLCGKETVV